MPMYSVYLVEYTDNIKISSISLTLRNSGPDIVEFYFQKIKKNNIGRDTVFPNNLRKISWLLYN